MSLIKFKSRVAVAILFCTFVGYMFVVNINLAKSPITSFINKKTNFGRTAKTIETNYISKKLKYRDAFINLNGLIARVTGRRTLNNVLLLRNKSLTFYNIKRNAKLGEYINKTVALANFSKILNIPFIYVATPSKVSTLKDNIPQGIEDYTNEYKDTFLRGLTDAGIDTLDLRIFLSSNSAQVNKFFYRTDHHWNADGAFAAFQSIMNKIETVQTKRKLNIKFTSANQWKRHEKKEWFLGSHGKRVGTLFGGTDSLTYYTPRFSTRMSLAVPHHTQFFKGDFVAANIKKKYIETKDYFNYNAYCVYIGGDYPLVYHRNIDAPNKMKVLVIKDSFVLPLQAFMSTVFSEVDVIDPRRYKASTIAEYILWTKPDLVLAIRNPYSVRSGFDYVNYDNYIVENFNSSQVKEILLKDYHVSLAASKSNWNSNKVPVTLQAGKTYTVSFKDIIIKHGKTNGISSVLWDSQNKKIINQKIFDVEFCRKYKEDGRWTFKVPEGEGKYSLLLYAGITGKTKNVGVEYKGIQVELLN